MVAALKQANKDMELEKEKFLKQIQDRDKKQLQVIEEVDRLKLEFTTHIAELETKLGENSEAAEVEHQLRDAL